VTGIKRNRRSLLGTVARWVILAAAFAGATYILDRFFGQRPGPWSAAVVGAGAFMLADLVGRTVRAAKRSSRAASGAPRSEVTCEVRPEPSSEVLALLEQGRKIQAIKRYRELNQGVGLKGAKDVIDGLERQVPSEGGTVEHRD
jgi:hypothetical protein